MRILAVDWGERRIGLAVSDPRGILATGLPTLSAMSSAGVVVRAPWQLSYSVVARLISPSPPVTAVSPQPLCRK